MPESDSQSATIEPGRIAKVRSRFLFAAAVLVLLGLAARLIRWLVNFPIWGDEAFLAVNFLMRGYADLFDPLLYGQIAPLGYTWAVETATRLAGVSEYTLRLPALLSGALALLVFWRFVVRTFSPRIALLAVGFLAGAYYVIRHGTEVKPYTTDLLVSVLITTMAWGVRCRPQSLLRWTGLIAVGALGVWASYPAVFVVGAAGLLLLWLALRERSAPVWAGLVAFVAIVGASAALMAVCYARPHAQAVVAELVATGMWSKTFPPLSQLWWLPLWFVWIHLGNMLAYPLGGDNGASVVTFVLVCIGVATLWRTRREMVLLLLSPLAFNLLAAALRMYPYGGSARTSLFMAPAFCLLGGLGLFTLLQRMPYPHRQRSIWIAAVVLGVIAIAVTVRDAVKPYKKEVNVVTEEVMREFCARVQPDDRLLLYAARGAPGYAPSLRDASGTGAILVFYMEWLAPAELELAPPPEELATSDGTRAGGDVWLVVFQQHRRRRVEPDGEKVMTPLFEEETLERYLARTEAVYGPARVEAFELRDDPGDRQTLRIYRFEGAVRP